MRILFLFMLTTLVVRSGPSPELKFDRISGVVAMGVWISECSVVSAKIPAEKEGFHIKRQSMSSVMLLVLEDVKGIDADVRSRMNAEFAMWLRRMPMLHQVRKEIDTKLEEDKRSLFWITQADETIAAKIKLGARVDLEGVSYFADDFGGHAKQEQMSIVPSSHVKLPDETSHPNNSDSEPRQPPESPPLGKSGPASNAAGQK